MATAADPGPGRRRRASTPARGAPGPGATSGRRGYVPGKPLVSPACFTVPVTSPLTPAPNLAPNLAPSLVPARASIRTTFARLCRETRLRLGMSQETVASAAGVSRGQIAKIELGMVDPSLDMAERIAVALSLEIDLIARRPVILEERRQRDAVHARCSGYVDRRLQAGGWLTAREVEIVHARSHGWIDLLAFDPRTGILLVVEVKTRLDDVGLVERQASWYERSAFDVAERIWVRPRRVVFWLAILATEEVEAVVRANRDVLALAFPVRAGAMAEVAGGAWPEPGRGLALIDPRSHRRDWLIRSRVDGRRTGAPYLDYADAARRLGT